MSSAARAIDSTISFELGLGGTIAGIDASLGMALIWGEGGQFACAETSSLGLSFGLLGGGASVGLSISQRTIHGGWETVGSSADDPDKCLAVGYSKVIGLAATISITPSKISPSLAEALIKNAFDQVMKNVKDNKVSKQKLLETVLSIASASGITGVGLDFTLSGDVIEIPTFLGNLDISLGDCVEKPLYCTGDGCTEKMEATKWKDGTSCEKRGIYSHWKSCDNCKNEAHPWGDGVTRCGVPKSKYLEDGTTCGSSPSCYSCMNRHTYWYSKLSNACGEEPRWGAGTICGAGTTCNACVGGDAMYSYWYSKAMTACGTEPKMWADGTLCGLGTTCNVCINQATYWAGAASTRCGEEPCWEKGTVCGKGTTEKSCCHGATFPWYSPLIGTSN